MTIPFKTTPNQVMELFGIVHTMLRDAWLMDEGEIIQAFDIAREDQGMFDLRKLWKEAGGYQYELLETKYEQEKIEKDLLAGINDYKVQETKEHA